ncbi:MAG: tetratricopeptide repeat protein [Saprospiraceae bacterium]
MGRNRKNSINQQILDLIEAYEQSDVTSFLDQEAFHEIINYYEQEGKRDLALKAARTACDQYRYEPDFYQREVMLLIQGMQWEAAQSTLEKGLGFCPSDGDLILLKAELKIVLGQREEGRQLLEDLKFMADNEMLSDIHLVESLAFEDEGEYGAVFDCLCESLALNPENEPALERFGLLMQMEVNPEPYRDALLSVIDAHPYAHLAWYYLGHAYAMLEEEENAKEAYEYAFLSKPDFEEGYWEYADYCYDLGHYAQAEPVYQEIAEKFGTDSDLLLQMGNCLHFLDKHETARSYLEQAAKLEPHNDEVIFRIGECYAAQEKWQKAVSYFQKAVRMQSEDEVYHHALANAAFELGDSTTALHSYTQALELAPDNKQIWLDFAWFYVETLQLDKAIDLLEEAYETLLDDEIQFAYIACLFAVGKRQQALQMLADVLPESYEGVKWLLEWNLTLRTDRDVVALLSLYKPSPES